MTIQPQLLDYPVIRLRGAYAHRACRRAVLDPLVGPAWRKSPGDAAGIAALLQLRARWIARVSSLADAGWPPAQGEKWVYLCNCPLFGTLPILKTMACKHSSVCPLCYARSYVYKAFRKLEGYAYGPSTSPADADGEGWRKPIRPNLHVYAFTVERNVLVEGVPYTPAALAGPHAEYAKSRIKTYRRTEIDHFKAAAGAVLNAVIPDRGSGRLVYRRGGVMLLNGPPAPTIEANYRKAKGVRLRSYGPVSKKALCWAFGRAFAYPPGLMSAAAADVVAVLHGMRRVHLFATYAR